MNTATEFLIYLTAFRLAIITAGTICIVLGYRLFVRGALSGEMLGHDGSIEAKVAGAKLTLKNAAPGTGFGFFGVVLITVMLIQGSPQFTYEDLKKAATQEDVVSSSKLMLRGGEGLDSFAALVEKGVAYERAGDPSRAIDAYKRALADASIPSNQLAWLYLQQGNVDNALPLARVAAEFNPSDARVLDTLAETLEKHGDRAEAEKWMEKAASIDPQYRDKLAALRRSGP